jgi:hypothetical protein
MAKVVEHLLSKHKALSSDYGATTHHKKREKEKEGERERERENQRGNKKQMS